LATQLWSLGQSCKKFGPCSNAELFVDVPEVRLYGCFAYEEALSNFTVRVAFLKFSKNFGFAQGEGFDSPQFPSPRFDPDSIRNSLVMRPAQETRKLNPRPVTKM
jgi:hypothetical protein